jgi:septal ring factor EnvC (AmiA/AmiB activator)
MKKVFLFACVAFALASCGNKAASNDEVKEDTVAVATDSDEAAEVTTALEEAINAETKDPSKIEATLTKVKEEYAKLVEEGKVEEAKKYALKIQEFISNNSESLKSAANNATVVSLIDGIKNLPTSAEATAQDAVAAVKADAKTVGDAAKNTAGVKDAVVNFMSLKMKVEFEEGVDVDAVMDDVLSNCKKVESDCEIYFK